MRREAESVPMTLTLTPDVPTLALDVDEEQQRSPSPHIEEVQEPVHTLAEVVHQEEHVANDPTVAEPAVDHDAQSVHQVCACHSASDRLSYCDMSG